MYIRSEKSFNVEFSTLHVQNHTIKFVVVPSSGTSSLEKSDIVKAACCFVLTMIIDFGMIFPISMYHLE